MGELLYKLKFGRDQTVVPVIADALEKFVKDWNPGIDVIVPFRPPANELSSRSLFLGMNSSTVWESQLSNVLRK